MGTMACALRDLEEKYHIQSIELARLIGHQNTNQKIQGEDTHGERLTTHTTLVLSLSLSLFAPVYLRLLTSSLSLSLCLPACTYAAPHEDQTREQRPQSPDHAAAE